MSGSRAWAVALVLAAAGVIACRHDRVPATTTVTTTTVTTTTTTTEPAPPPVITVAPPAPPAPPPPVVDPCPRAPNVAACPSAEPNVNGSCKKKGIACIYATGCCPNPTYVCVKASDRQLRFEARFSTCD